MWPQLGGTRGLELADGIILDGNGKTGKGNDKR